MDYNEIKQINYFGGDRMTKTKKNLRTSMRTQLSQIDDNERLDVSKKLQRVLFNSEIWKNAETIGVYISFKTEWDTRNIIKKAFNEGKNVAIPKTIPETRRLDFYKITDLSQVEKVTSGNFLIEEPIVESSTYLDKNNIDLLIVPGLIFSKDGYRIGFGGGYYDRFLTDFIHTTISLVSMRQLKESIPIEKHDIPVDYIITENGFLI